MIGKKILSFISFILFAFAFSNEFELYRNHEDNKVYKTLKINETMNIDGILDEESWTLVNPLNDFIQVFPDLLSYPSNVSSVKILYDDYNLYFGITLNQDSENISYKVGSYDSFGDTFQDNSDYFVIELDSYHKHNNSYGFAVNASNIKADYMIYDDDLSSVDDYWNADWNSEVKINQDNWVIEIVIPLTQLRFPDKNDQVWGLNFIRYIKNNNETVCWSVVPELSDKIISQYGHLINLNVEHKSHWRFKPYYWSGEIKYEDDFYTVVLLDGNPSIDDVSDSDHKINSKDKYGFDFKYNFNANNIIDFTFKPDYGQIEQDPSIVNNTAYEIDYDEKRPFFLENAEFYRTPIRTFYSRRIGGNIPVTSEIAVEYLGKTFSKKTNFNKAVNLLGHNNNWQYGFLYADSKIDDYQSKNIQYFLLRNKYRISKKLFIGMMNTYCKVPSIDMVFNTHPINSLKIENKVNAIDFSFDLLNSQSLNIDGQFAQSIADNIKGYGGNIEIGYSHYINLNKSFEMWLKFEDYDKKFDINKMGFLLRNDIKDLDFGFSFDIYDINYFLQRAITFQHFYSENYNSITLEHNIDISFNALFKNYSTINFGLAKDFDHYIDKFYDWYFSEDNSDVFIKAPLYEQIYLKYSNDNRENTNYTIEFKYYLDNFNNAGIDYLITNTYKINDKMEVELTYDEKNESSKYHFLKRKRLSNSGITMGSTEGFLTSFYRDRDNFDYLFVDSNNKENIFTFRLSSYYNDNISIDFYYEFYKYLNDWDENSQLHKKVENYEYPQVADFNTEIGNDKVNENKIIYVSKYSSVAFNFVIKARILTKSNLHFVYSLSKAVNGKVFNRVVDLLDFSIEDINQNHLAEIYYNSSFFIKYDFAISR